MGDIFSRYRTMLHKECDGCKYLRSLYGKGVEGPQVCHYILEKHKKRPCPPGAECTVGEEDNGKKASKVRRKAYLGLTPSGKEIDKNGR